MLDRAGDIDRDLRKASRRTFKSKKRKNKGGKSGRKLAKRNSRQIEELAGEVAALRRQLAQQGVMEAKAAPRQD